MCTLHYMFNTQSQIFFHPHICALTHHLPLVTTILLSVTYEYAMLSEISHKEKVKNYNFTHI